MVQIIIPTYNALTQAAGDGHVDRLMALLPTTGDALTIEGFEATALGAFHAAGLFSRDLLRRPTRHPQRTVLEPRTVVAGVPAHFSASSAVSSSSSSSAAAAASSASGASSAAVASSSSGQQQQQQQQQRRRIFVQASAWSGAADESVRPPRAANAHLHMDPVMTAQSGWRGPLLSTSKAVLDLASMVVGNALALTRTLGGPDEACVDDQWMVSGREALCHLFSTKDPAAILRRFQVREGVRE